MWMGTDKRDSGRVSVRQVLTMTNLAFSHLPVTCTDSYKQNGQHVLIYSSKLTFQASIFFKKPEIIKHPGRYTYLYALQVVTRRHTSD